MQEIIPAAFGNRLRLLILAYLMRAPMDFTTLRGATGSSDGNLSTQLSHLEREGYVACEKRLVGGKTRSTYEATLKAKEEYRALLVFLLESLLGKQH